MTARAKYAKRISNLWTFFYGPYQIRVDDTPLALTAIEARKIADAAHEGGGAHCTRCHAAAQFRIVKSDAPTDALCYDCAEPNYDAALSPTV